MCHSNLRLVFLLAGLALLFGCSSIGELQKTNDNAELKEQVKDAKNSAVSVAATANKSEEALFQGPDPMADIQINAEIKKVYRQVAEWVKSKDYVKALNSLDSIQKKYPQLSGPSYQKARIYFAQKKYAKAIEAIELCLNSNQRNYFALNLKGVILKEQGKFNEAKETYYKAIEVYPPYPKSHLNLGVLADVYLRDLGLAKLQYSTYMKLTGNQDKKVNAWVVELDRRIKAAQ